MPSTGDDALLLRLVDASTAKPIVDLAGLVISWNDRRNGRRGALPHEDGWFRLPEIGDVGEIEVGVPGYARARFDPRRRTGRVELALEPDGPGVVGSITVPGGKVAGPVEVSLRPVEVDRRLPEFQVIGIPTGAGALLLYDLPAGRYELEITSIVDGVCVRAKRRIEHLGLPLDIGGIELERWAGIRARVVDLDGRYVPQARVVIVREEEDERKGRVVEPDQKGWVTFADFEPGAWHRVAAFGLPGPLDRLVLAPEKRGELVTVELTWPGRLVTCVLRFPAGDRLLPPSAIIDLRGPVKLRGEHVTGENAIAVDLLPGEHVWRWVSGPSGPPQKVEARVVVPPQRRFEVEVPLRDLLRKD
ncbi:MAG: hypothetical protein ACYTGJ_14055 [Planctomycetota bacterium]